MIALYREATSILCKSSFLAFGPVFLLAAAVLAGEPLFDTRPDHPWDQAREISGDHVSKDIFLSRRAGLFGAPHCWKGSPSPFYI